MSQQTVFNGRYELHRRIARGGMADVFLARDQLLDRPVAVKVLFPEFATDPAFVARFRREAQAAANLNHPNIVGVYDWGEQAGTYFIVMEYVDGRSLADIIRPRARCTPTGRPTSPSDVAAALGLRPPQRRRPPRREAGQRAASRRGQVKVADFGIARAIDAADENLTQTGVGDGHGHVLLARAGAGPPARPAQRPLLARRRALRDGHRPAAVLRRQPRGDRLQARAGDADAAAPHQPRRAVAARSDHPRLLSQEPGRPLPVGRGSARRPPPLPRGPAGAGAAARRPWTPPAAIAATQAVRAYSDGTRMVPVDELPREYQPPRRTGAFLVVLVMLLLSSPGLLVLLARVLGVGDRTRRPRRSSCRP